MERNPHVCSLESSVVCGREQKKPAPRRYPCAGQRLLHKGPEGVWRPCHYKAQFSVSAATWRHKISWYGLVPLFSHWVTWWTHARSLAMQRECSDPLLQDLPPFTPKAPYLKYFCLLKCILKVIILSLLSHVVFIKNYLTASQGL